MVSSYFLNAAWTFEKKPLSLHQAGKFILINVFILFLSELILKFILTHVTHSVYLGQAFNLIPITILGFFANQAIVFCNTDKSVEDGKNALPVRTKKTLFFAAMGLVIVHRILITISAMYISQTTRVGWTWYSLLISGYTHWDSSWYIEIAKGGYKTQLQTAFWPLYPWLMARLHDILGTTYASCGIVISLCSFVVAVYLLGLLVFRYFRLSTALAAMALFAFSPTSFYFDAVYTESLFLALSIAAVYASTTNRFLIASILVMFATLTRNTGIILSVIVVFDYLRWRKIGFKLWQSQWWKGLNRDACWLPIPIIGLFFYCIWLNWKFGNPFAFLTAEKHWYRVYMPAWETYTKSWYLLFDSHQTTLSNGYLLFEIATFSVAILFILLGLRYISRSEAFLGWWVYILAVTWIASTEPSMNIPDYLVSFPRYLLMLFPGIVYLADILRPKWIQVGVVVLFGIILYQKNGLFYIHQWIA